MGFNKKKKTITPITTRDYFDVLTVPTTEDGKFGVKPTPTKPKQSLVAEREVSNVDNLNKPEVQEPEVNKTKQYLDDYKTKLKLDTANTESEIMSANKLANQYLQNYLKQQGLVGTGLGQSQYVNLANNYANQMSQLRADEQTRLEEESENYQTSRTKELTTLLGTMNANEREKYLQEIAKTEGLDQRYLDTLETQSKLLSAQDTQNAIANIEKLIQYGASPTVIQGEIDKLKAKGVDTSSLETLMSATGSDMKSQAIEMYKNIITALNKTDFIGDRSDYAEVKDDLYEAIQSGDGKLMAEAYNKAFNLIEGVPEFNSTGNNGDFTINSLYNGAKVYMDGKLVYTIDSIGDDGTVWVKKGGSKAILSDKADELIKKFNKDTRYEIR